jgi:Ca2+-binding RTX toxin-like protein
MQGPEQTLSYLGISEDLNPPTYKLEPSTATIKEGGTLSYTLSTTSVPAGTLLSYALSGITSDDLVTGGLDGWLTVGADGKASLSLRLRDDYLLERSEILSMNVMYGKVVKATAAPVAIVDNSLLLTGTKGRDIFPGSDYSEEIKAGSGNDLLTGGRGNDRLIGDDGLDTANYLGKRVNYTVGRAPEGVWVTDKVGDEGVDLLVDIERIEFADKVIGLDANGSTGQAYRLYKAAFNRASDEGGLGYWISVLDKGTALTTVASGFVNSAEFKTLYGANATHGQLIDRFYLNVLHRMPDKAGYDYWLGELDSKHLGTADVLLSFAESAENQAALVGLIQNGISYIPYG